MVKALSVNYIPYDKDLHESVVLEIFGPQKSLKEQIYNLNFVIACLLTVVDDISYAFEEKKELYDMVSSYIIGCLGPMAIKTLSKHKNFLRIFGEFENILAPHSHGEFSGEL